MAIGRRMMVVVAVVALMASAACDLEETGGGQLEEDAGGADIEEDTNGKLPDADDPDTDDPDADDLGTDPDLLDLLWVIDNSGSMCRTQGVIHEVAQEFLESLESEGMDFQIGVTTTHVADCDGVDPEAQPWHPCSLAPVAKSGHLQATPQPIPGFDESCHHPIEVGADGTTVEFDRDRYDPIEENLVTAVGCTVNPEEYSHLLEFDAEWEANIRCGLGLGASGDCDNAPELAELFPDPADYRAIPKVMRSEDYADMEAMAEDFVCASLVGSRGYGFEQGLTAAVKAVSPELTGGPGADPSAYPNAGLIRPHARTGVIFVTDENDCSHDGTLDTATQCGVNQCTIAEGQGSQGPLLPAGELATEFRANVEASKGVGPDEASGDLVLAASFHGESQVPDFDDVPDSCPTAGGFWVQPSCISELTLAWSGHRYEEFIRHFDDFYPSPAGDDLEQPVPGLICEAELLTEGMRGLAELFKR